MIQTVLFSEMNVQKSGDMYPWWGNSDHRRYISELNFSTVAVVIEARTHICPSASGCCPDPVTCCWHLWLVFLRRNILVHTGYGRRHRKFIYFLQLTSFHTSSSIKPSCEDFYGLLSRVEQVAAGLLQGKEKLCATFQSWTLGQGCCKGFEHLRGQRKHIGSMLLKQDDTGDSKENIVMYVWQGTLIEEWDLPIISNPIIYRGVYKGYKAV